MIGSDNGPGILNKGFGRNIPWPIADRPTAAYAQRSHGSRGRKIAEPDCPMRSGFQRDRDRILHGSAFRRLTYKTQVFLFHEGDHYRTRLTHTLEVAQIARQLARLLHLEEDLAEALALAHDLGHPPFGHAGERALDRAMKASGGFDHNAQSLRVVTRLERKYAAFDGLNLTLETLDGIVKHNGPATGPRALKPDSGALLEVAVQEAGLDTLLTLDEFAGAEAQAAAIADDIAWHNHDIDDGLRAGLIEIDQLVDVPLVGALVRDVLESATIEPRRAIYEVSRRLITLLIADCVSETRRRLGELKPASPTDIQRASLPVVAFSDDVASELARLKAFLFAHVYRHPRVTRVMNGAENIVVDLFERYSRDDLAAPEALAAHLSNCSDAQRAGRIRDYLAGMTDRFAVAEHQRLFDATPELR